MEINPNEINLGMKKKQVSFSFVWLIDWEKEYSEKKANKRERKIQKKGGK